MESACIYVQAAPACFQRIVTSKLNGVFIKPTLWAIEKKQKWKMTEQTAGLEKRQDRLQNAVVPIARF